MKSTICSLHNLQQFFVNIFSSGDISTLDPGAAAGGGGGDQKVLTLAEQFLAAMPARIKNPNDYFRLSADTALPVIHHHDHDPMQWEDCSCDASQSDDLGIESMGDDLDMDLNIEECQAYRYVCLKYKK